MGLGGRGSGVPYRPGVEFQFRDRASGLWRASGGRGQSGRCATGTSARRRNRSLVAVFNVGVAWGLYTARDFQGASEQSWKVLAMEPKFGAAQYTLGPGLCADGSDGGCHCGIVECAHLFGDQPAVLAALAYVTRGGGESAAASALFFGELEDLVRHRYVSPYWLGLVYAGLGDQRRARWSCWTRRMRNGMSG